MNNNKPTTLGLFNIGHGGGVERLFSVVGTSFSDNETSAKGATPRRSLTLPSQK
jgi:hypothetical protein